ncbi:MAG: SDR family oxidoreductase [bacterium]
MEILVTGAGGFLGTNIVLNCLQKGWKVRAFTLPGSQTKYIQHPDVQIIYGDVADSEAIKYAMSSVDAVIHCAGDTSFWKKLFDRQRKTNVDGVKNVMQSALELKIKKVVHTSTVDAFGYNPDGLTDEHWNLYNYAGWKYNYGDTKREGQLIALSYAKQGLDVVIINPGSMIGPFDHTLQFGRLFMDIRDHKIPAIPPGGAPWAHVNEVAKAHIVALEKGRRGEMYICGGINATYKTVFEEIARSINVKPPKFVMPGWMTVGYGYVMEFISNFTNKKPDLNPGQARYMSVFPKYDSSKAEKELGFVCVPIKKMVEDARDWYKENGFL